MVRAICLGATAVLGSLMSLPLKASSETVHSAAFSRVSASNFDALFNSEVARSGGSGALIKSSCTGTTCTFIYGTVGVNVSSVNGSDRLDGLMWICAKNCEAAQFALGIIYSLKVLAPGLTNNQYGAWVGGFAEALKTKSKFKTIVGQANLSVGPYGDLGLLAFISSDN